MHKLLSKEGLTMTAYGYARVSTNGQDLAAQEAELMAAGCAKVSKKKVWGGKPDGAELARVIRRFDPGAVLLVPRLESLHGSTRALPKVLAPSASGGLASAVSRTLGPIQLRRM